MEASTFRGREPDEDRLDIDLGALDSYAVRGSWIRGGTRAQISVGRIEEPDITEPGDVTRITASIEHTGLVFGHDSALTVAWGQNREPFSTENGVLAEMTWRLWPRGTIYGRGEVADKHIIGAGGQHPPGLQHPHIISTVGVLLAGYTHELWRAGANALVHRRRHFRLPRARKPRRLHTASRSLFMSLADGWPEPDGRNQEPGTRNQESARAPDTARGTRHAALGTEHGARGTQHAARRTRHAAPGTKHRTLHEEQGTKDRTQHQERGNEARGGSAILSPPNRRLNEPCSCDVSPGRVWIDRCGDDDGTSAAAGRRSCCRPADAAKTWTDADLDKLMKEIGSTVGAVAQEHRRTERRDWPRTRPTRLKTLFEHVDDFWSARNVKDAADIADDAAEHADHIEDAIDAKDFAKAGEHMKLLQATCAAATASTATRDPTAHIGSSRNGRRVGRLASVESEGPRLQRGSERRLRLTARSAAHREAAFPATVSEPP